MNVRTFRAASFLLGIVVSFAAPAHAVTYTATLLHPAGYVQSQGFGNSGTNQVGYKLNPGVQHAVLWNSTAANAIDLQPAGYFDSIAYGVSGGNQAGSALMPDHINMHAMLWSGTAASVVDLNPSGIIDSVALGISVGQQVGYGSGTRTDGNRHALLWNGTASSVVDLNPQGGDGFSEAVAVSGSSQVGVASSFAWHATLWNGTPESAVDLHPTGYSQSFATNVWGATQVGWADHHAILWSGTAASAVDLNPAGFDSSEADGVFGVYQVGFGFGPTTGNTNHALLWSGTAASAVDLHAYVSGLIPNAYQSLAHQIAADGSIVGEVGDLNGQFFAVLWTPVTVPEPAFCVLLANALAIIFSTRVRRLPRLTN